MSRIKRIQLSSEALETARRHPFGPQVLGDDFVVCLECGRCFQALGGHLPRKHGMSVQEYKAEWGYNRTQPLMSAVLIEQFIAQGKAMPQYDYVMEKLNQNRPVGKGNGKPATKRAQGLPALIARNRLQASQAPQGADSKQYRQDVSEARVAELLAQGHSKGQVADLLHCDRHVVYTRLRALGLNRPRRRADVTAEAVAAAWDAGYRTLNALAERFHCSKHLITLRLKAAGLRAPRADAA